MGKSFKRLFWLVDMAPKNHPGPDLSIGMLSTLIGAVNGNKHPLTQEHLAYCRKAMSGPTDRTNRGSYIHTLVVMSREDTTTFHYRYYLHMWHNFGTSQKHGTNHWDSTVYTPEN